MFFSAKNKNPQPVSGPAMVYAELPHLPKTTPPGILEEWDHTMLEGPGAQRPQEPGLASGKVRSGYMLEFSDGQRIAVGSRCVAGRIPPSTSEGYEIRVVLNDPSHQTSRRHFEFGVTPLGQVWVMDCDSANGTWLDSGISRGQLPKFVRTRMVPGDTLRFGDMRAMLKVV
jgi:hypothetical protein